MKLNIGQFTIKNLKKITAQGKKGFTFIEAMLYVATLSIVILAVSGFVLWLVRSNTKAKTMREVSDNARRVMGIMTHEIREAESIYAPTASSNQLSLETKRYLPTGEEKSYIDFFVCGTNLCLKEESQDPISLTSDSVQVSSLTFTQVGTGPSSVQIDLTLSYKNPQNRSEYNSLATLSSVVSLRIR